jgi:hypothetical protein
LLSERRPVNSKLGMLPSTTATMQNHICKSVSENLQIPQLL